MVTTTLSELPGDISLRGRVHALPLSERRFWAAVAATGLLAGLGAVGLVAMLDFVQGLAWHGEGTFLERVARASPGRRLIVPALAGVLVTGVSLLLGAPVKGHGTAGVLEGIWVKSGRLPFARALLRGSLSITAVGCGAPLGREGALVSTGAAAGSLLSRWLRLTPTQARILVACGAASGVAAAYNVPIGGALFGLEVLLGSVALELFGPLVVSCVIATLTSRVLVSNHPTYLIPHYSMGTALDLGLAGVLGLTVGLLSVVYVRGIDGFSTMLERAPRWLGYLLPVVAMAAIGGVAVVRPDLLGNGYEVVNSALRGGMPILLLLVLPFAKLLATSFTAGAGVPGGLFTPSLFFGALLGGAFGHFAHALFPSVEPGAFALLGMGAVLAGTTHASISSVLIIFEMTGDYGAILPLMLASVVAHAVSRRIEPDSLYTSVLRRKKVAVQVAAAPEWLHSETVEALTEPAGATIGARASLEEALVILLEDERRRSLYVIDVYGRPIGVLSVEALRGYLPHHRLLAGATVDQVMAQVTPLREGASLSEAAHAFITTNQDELPVVDRAGRLRGTILKSAVLAKGRF